MNRGPETGKDRPPLGKDSLRRDDREVARGFGILNKKERDDILFVGFKGNTDTLLREDTGKGLDSKCL